MQRQMPFTTQPLVLNPLKNMVQVDEIDYSADFENLYLRMDDFNKFFQTQKISYNVKIYTMFSKNNLSRTVAFDRNKKKTCR